MCDVAREAGDELIGALRELELDRTGSIAVDNIDLSLSERADKAEDEAPGEGADAVLWEHLADATHEESTLTVTYVAFLAVATMLAACGVMLDNAILIVGAMAVGPEFGPLAGISTALVQRAPRLVWRSLWALLAGFAAAMVLTAGFSWLMDVLGLFDRSMIDGPRPNTAFIWNPDWMSFVVAFLAEHRGHPVPHVREVGCADRRGDLGDDGPGRRERRRLPQLHGLLPDLGLHLAAPRQPRRHRAGRHAHAARPEGVLGLAAQAHPEPA